MRVGIIGGGTIARLFLQHIRAGDLGGAQVVAIVGRNAASRGKALAAEFSVPFVLGIDELLRQRPDVVVEAAAHEAVRDFGPSVLTAGVVQLIMVTMTVDQGAVPTVGASGGVFGVLLAFAVLNPRVAGCDYR